MQVLRGRRAFGAVLAVTVFAVMLMAGSAQASVLQSIGAPVDNAVYTQNDVATYFGLCQQDGNNANLSTCEVTISRVSPDFQNYVSAFEPIANDESNFSGPLPDDQPGLYQMTVAAGGTGTGPGSFDSRTIHYTVVAPPPPPDPPTFPSDFHNGETVTRDAGPPFFPSCPGAVSCTTTVKYPDGHTVTVPYGSPLPSDQTGHYTVTITATGADGQTSTTTGGYDVVNPPPPPTPSFPANFTSGEVVQQGSGSPFSPSCSGSAVSCTTKVTCPPVGPVNVPNGAPLPSSTSGDCTVVVTAADRYGQTSSITGTYHVNAPPTISIVNPPGGASTPGQYYLNESIPASYSCADSDDHVTACNGPVGNGSPMDTSSTGGKSFTVNAADSRGGTATQTVNYTVYDRPTAAITSPPVGSVDTPGQIPAPPFHGGCAGGIPATTCTLTAIAPDGTTSTIHDGDAVPNSQYGIWTLSVTAVDKRGTIDVATRTYKVNHPPTIQLDTPIGGVATPGEYYLNEAIGAVYSCADSDGTVTLCAGPVAAGANIDTGSLGGHSFTVNAKDNDNATATKTVDYTVYKRPTVFITSPAVGTVHTPGQTPQPVFHGGCDGGIPAVTCTLTVTAPDGTVSTIHDGDLLPNTQYGYWTIKEHVSDKRPTTDDLTRVYRVNRAPSASIATPSATIRYFQDQTVKAAYSCADVRDVVPNPQVDGIIASCVGNVPVGSPIDTSTPGVHTFTVKATDNDGATGSTSVTYKVYPVIGVCRASSLRLLGLVFGTANEPSDPCKSDTRTDVNVNQITGNPNSGLGLLVNSLTGLSVQAGALTGTTFRGHGPAGPGSTAGTFSASTDIANASIKVGAVTIGVNAVHSDVASSLTTDCDHSIQGGTVRIGQLTINGVPTNIVADQPITIPLIIGTLYINQSVTGPNNLITKRALFLDLPGTALDVVIGETTAGAYCGPLPTT